MKKFVSIVLSVVVLLSIVIAAPTVAFAEDMYKFKSFSMTLNNAPVQEGALVGSDDKLKLQFTYSLTYEEICEVLDLQTDGTIGVNNKFDESFAIQIPEGLTIDDDVYEVSPVSVPFDINVEGTNYDFELGKMHFDPAAKTASFKFTNTAELLKLVNAHEVDFDAVNLQFDCNLDMDKIGNAKSYTINTPVTGTKYVAINIRDNQDVLPSITDKQGVYDADTRTVTWTVTANTGKPLPTELTFFDTLDANQTFVAGTFKIDGTAPTGDVAYDEIENTIAYPLSGYEENKTIAITYETKLRDSLFVDTATSQLKDVNIKAKNAAKWVWDDGETAEKIGSVSIEKNWLTKNGEVDFSNHTVTWTIKVAANGSNATNVVIYDEMTDVLTYKANFMHSSPWEKYGEV